uniref:Glycosyltransferase RgtA/B/C/D-like domain-containing protein n=1 Tax=uncultured Armatimonadetes bacterium TaxID=157466 RepID=A0A6J4J853_9BACT|nr:hypothetical protein AVDCRST_MAG63-2931 [uncultured Armatimonadetes bacterium]
MVAVSPHRDISSGADKRAGTAASAALVWGVALLVFASRMLFRSHYLYHWDSVNFAFSLMHYDVRLAQPHPPGYILYVALARLVQGVVGDANLAMQLISAVCSGLLVVALWRLAERFFGPESRAGLIVGLLAATNPLLWFYGSVALPHVLDAVLMTVIALLGWRILHGEGRLLFPSALLLGVAAGVRQQDLVFLMPLWLFCVRREGVRRIVPALALTGAVCVAWLWPMIALSGGLNAYRSTVAAYTQHFFSTTSLLHGAGLTGVLYNVDKLLRYTLYAVAFALPVLLLTFGQWRRAPGERLGGERGLFLLLWAAPSLAFYSLIHMGQHGLIFTFLPPLLLAIAGLLSAAGTRGVTAAAVAAAASALFFMAAPEHLLPGDGFKVLNSATLRNLDNGLENAHRTLRRRFPADETVVVSRNFRHTSYYLPEYPVVWSKAWDDRPSRNQGVTLWQRYRARPVARTASGGLSLPARARYLVILGDGPRLRLGDGVRMEQVGDGMRCVTLPPRAHGGGAAVRSSKAEGLVIASKL